MTLDLASSPISFGLDTFSELELAVLLDTFYEGIYRLHLYGLCFWKPCYSCFLLLDLSRSSSCYFCWSIRLILLVFTNKLWAILSGAGVCGTFKGHDALPFGYYQCPESKNFQDVILVKFLSVCNLVLFSSEFLRSWGYSEDLVGLCYFFAGRFLPEDLRRD